MAAPSAVLLDMDGVLVDSRAAIGNCINHALEAHGLRARPLAALRRHIGPPLIDTFASLAGPEQAASCLAVYRERYVTSSLEETVPVPGIRDVLARLAERTRLVVATSKPHAYAVPICERLGFTEHLDAVVGPDLAAPDEIKAVTVRRALAAARSSDAPLVGDREHDAIAARANGIPCIGALWGIGDEDELRAAGAAPLLRGPDELPAALGFAD